MVTRRLALGITVTALALAACQVIVGIQEVDKVEPTSDGASSTSSGSTGSTGGPRDPCAHALVPTDAGSRNDPGEDRSIWIAMQSIVITRSPDTGLAGFDLDNTCTCDTRENTRANGARTCKQRPPSLFGDLDSCDGDGGLDNQATRLFALPALANSGLDEDINEDIEAGKRTVMLWVSEWNGQPNDVDVLVGLFVSNGTGVDPDDNTKFIQPRFDGADEWTYQPPAVRTGATSFRHGSAVRGFVRDGRLVATAGGDVDVTFGDSVVRFGGATVAGDLAQNGGRTTFNGILAGRIRVSDFLAAAGRRDEGCKRGALFEVARTAICNGADIPSSVNSDNNPETFCDAISSTVVMKGVDAKIRDESRVVPEDTTNPCSPDNVPKGTYECQ